MELTSAQIDRACGVLLGSACGDALGAGYEFGAASYDGWPAMIGGGLGDFAPGEWTDDTAQAVAIARVAATGADLRTEEALTSIANGFADWYAGGPSDVGIQTSAVLRQAGRTPTAQTMAGAAKHLHERTGRSAGNGSLMRTAPVALAHLDDPTALVEAAIKVSALTHHDPLAGEGAALWCLMIRHAVLTGKLPNAASSVAQLEEVLDRPTHWAARLDEAERQEPGVFIQNGWVVGALQAAWSAIVQTPEPGDFACRHFQTGLATAIGIGNDTDTVAAIAGALLGARWGASAVPQEWQSVLHGWGLDGVDLDSRTVPAGAAGLVALATLTVHGGRTKGASGWPLCERMDYAGWGGEDSFAAHPLVDGVWLGGALALDDLPSEIDVVVSLCRIGTAQVPDHVAGHVVRLIDTNQADNPNLDFVVDAAARAILRLRDDGKRVYLHCVAAQSCTPTVAARVAVLAGTPLPEALDRVCADLPTANPRAFLLGALERLSEADRAVGLTASGDNQEKRA